MNNQFSLKDVVVSSVHGTHCTFVKLFVDMPGILLAYFVINFTKASANFVTILGGVFALLSAMSVLNNNIIIAGLLFYCSFILDFIDGKVARLRKTSSHFGKKLDLAFDRIIFVLLTLVYLQYFENNEMLVEKSLLIAFAMMYLTFDLLETVDSMVWQREIIESLLAGKSVDSHFGINNFKTDNTNIRIEPISAYFSSFLSLKKWFPSKLSLTGYVFFVAPILSFEIFYTLALLVLGIRMIWLLRIYFFR